MERLAYKIRFFRTQKNWTQHDLAKHLSVSRSVVAKWENSSTVPDAISVVKLCKLFDISADFLLGRENSYVELLKDTSPLYELEANQQTTYELANILDLILVNPTLKDSLLRLSKLSFNKQHSLLEVMSTLVEEIEQL